MTDSISILDDFTAWCAANRARVIGEVDCFKRAVIPALRQRGVATVEVVFDGYGDSGAVENIGYRDAADAEIELSGEVAIHVEQNGADTVEVTLTKALEDLTYAALELHHPGWENNDGAGGTLEINVAAGTFALDCKLRYTAYDDHYTEL